MELKSYADIDNQAATWFVDPPYQQAGKRYRKKRIDYDHLGQWSKERCGQVVVCEQDGADWLEFQVFKQFTNGSNETYGEVIWTRSDRKTYRPSPDSSASPAQRLPLITTAARQNTRHEQKVNVEDDHWFLLLYRE